MSPTRRASTSPLVGVPFFSTSFAHFLHQPPSRGELVHCVKSPPFLTMALQHAPSTVPHHGSLDFSSGGSLTCTPPPMRKTDASSASNPYLVARRSMASLRILFENSDRESVRARDMVAEKIAMMISVMQSKKTFSFQFFCRTQILHLLRSVERSVAGAAPKIEMLFLCWTSQNEDQQHYRKNCESEVCRAEAVALVNVLYQTCSATSTGAVHMGRSISLAINQKSGIRSPFFVGARPLQPRKNCRAEPIIRLSWKLTKIRCNKKLKSFLLLHLHSINHVSHHLHLQSTSDHHC